MQSFIFPINSFIPTSGFCAKIKPQYFNIDLEESFQKIPPKELINWNKKKQITYLQI